MGALPLSEKYCGSLITLTLVEFKEFINSKLFVGNLLDHSSQTHSSY